MIEDMDTTMEVLARRAVACKGFRWMPGMLVERPDGIEEAEEAALALEPVQRLVERREHA